MSALIGFLLWLHGPAWALAGQPLSARCDLPGPEPARLIERALEAAGLSASDRQRPVRRARAAALLPSIRLTGDYDQDLDEDFDPDGARTDTRHERTLGLRVQLSWQLPDAAHRLQRAEAESLRRRQEALELGEEVLDQWVDWNERRRQWCADAEEESLERLRYEEARLDLTTGGGLLDLLWYESVSRE